MSLLYLLECHGGDVIDRTEMVFYLSDTPQSCFSLCLRHIISGLNFNTCCSCLKIAIVH